MGKKRKHKQLSFEQVWDDRGLIDSWNQAYEEYQLYHSIHARGEDVDAVLAAAEADGGAGQAPDASAAAATLPSSAAAGPLGEWQPLDEDPDAPAPETALNSTSSQPPAAESVPSAPTNGVAPAPGMIHSLMASSTSDEALKNLMMSWYWAGYYTGLREGQQQRQQQQHPAD